MVATTVGYGHQIVPQSDGAKIFLVFYMPLSIFMVASSLRSLSGVYLNVKKSAIENEIVESTIWVHKSDVLQRGAIQQSDYGTTNVFDYLDLTASRL